MDDDTPPPASGEVPRRTRDRAATERQILDAALRLLKRDGVLAGLNLREVADEAGVNRGLIYQRYGSRQELLRAAISDLGWTSQPVFHEGRSLPFAERRQAVFESALDADETLRLLALLALDAREPITIFPMLERTREDLARDVASGAIADDVDPLVAHFLTAATYMGYAVYREHFARDAGIDPDELDRRARATFAQMLRGLAGTRSDDADTETST
jgi:AcrR family transcriptional regulator